MIFGKLLQEINYPLPLIYHVFSKNKNQVYACELKRHGQHYKDIISSVFEEKFKTEESRSFQYILKDFTILLSV